MHSKKAVTVLRREIGLSTFLAQANLILRVFLFSNMAAVGEKTLTYTGLSLRAGGQGFSPAAKRVAPSYFYWKIEEK